MKFLLKKQENATEEQKKKLEEMRVECSKTEARTKKVIENIQKNNAQERAKFESDFTILRNANSQFESSLNAKKIQMASELKSQRDRFDQIQIDNEKQLKGVKDAFEKKEKENEKTEKENYKKEKDALEEQEKKKKDEKDEKDAEEAEKLRRCSFTSVTWKLDFSTVLIQIVNKKYEEPIFFCINARYALVRFASPISIIAQDAEKQHTMKIHH